MENITACPLEHFLSTLSKTEPSHYIPPPETDSEFGIMESILNNIDNVYDKKTCQLLWELVYFQRKIIVLVKKGNTTELDSTIFTARRNIRYLQGEGKFVGKSFLYPSLAFYYYSSNKFGLAKKYLSWTIRADDHITYKWPIIHYHKIQQLLNLGKIYSLQNNFSDTAKLYIELLKYFASGNLIATYGKGNIEYLNRLYTIENENEAVYSVLSHIFMVLLDNPTIEKILADNYQLLNILGKSNNEFLNAFFEFLKINHLLNSGEINHSMILNYFNRYKFYLYDPFKILILREIYSNCNKDSMRTLIFHIIEKQLKFKSPQGLINNFEKVKEIKRINNMKNS